MHIFEVSEQERIGNLLSDLHFWGNQVDVIKKSCEKSLNLCGNMCCFPPKMYRTLTSS